MCAATSRVVTDESAGVRERKGQAGRLSLQAKGISSPRLGQGGAMEARSLNDGRFRPARASYSGDSLREATSARPHIRDGGRRWMVPTWPTMRPVA